MMRPAQYGEPPNRRKTQVAIAMLFDRTAKQIARELQLAPQTVEQYRSRLYRKFGVNTKGQLIHLLMQERTP